jgi:hypothetical protein
MMVVVDHKTKPPDEYSCRRLCLKESPEVSSGELVARTAAIATSAETAAIFTRFGFADVQRAPANLTAIELLNRRIAFFFGRHFDEG